VRRVVVTGSESTGKTTLAAALATRFACPWSAEFARAYAAGASAPLTASDVEPIALGQIANQERAIALASTLVVHDTDLLSTVIYARHYYGRCPRWIEDDAERRLADLYLLCAPDVPWIADPQRDRPHQREELHALFDAELRRQRATVVEITGDWPARTDRATAAVQELCTASPTRQAP
jgi:NadR type nicotinamide-nucleotide adenylyltransferase